VGVSSHIQIGKYKSPLRVVAAMLWRSRETQARRAEEFKQEREELRQQNQELQALLRQAQDQADGLKEQLRELQIEVQALENQPVRLPIDPVLPCHHYGPKMIALSINLAQDVGLRGAESALYLFHDCYGITVPVPHWTTIRTWMQRVGGAALAVEEHLHPAALGPAQVVRDPPRDRSGLRGSGVIGGFRRLRCAGFSRDDGRRAGVGNRRRPLRCRGDCGFRLAWIAASEPADEDGRYDYFQ